MSQHPTKTVEVYECVDTNECSCPFLRSSFTGFYCEHTEGMKRDTEKNQPERAELFKTCPLIKEDLCVKIGNKNTVNTNARYCHRTGRDFYVRGK